MSLHHYLTWNGTANCNWTVKKTKPPSITNYILCYKLLLHFAVELELQVPPSPTLLHEHQCTMQLILLSVHKMHYAY